MSYEVIGEESLHTWLALTHLGSGLMGTPSLTFINDTNHNTGIYRVSENIMGLVTGGSTRSLISNATINLLIPLCIDDTSGANITAMELAMAGDPTIGGVYKRAVDDSLYWYTNGSGEIDLNIAYPLLAPDGTVTDPSYSFASDTNTGIYRVGAEQLGFTAGGTLRYLISDVQTTS